MKYHKIKGLIQPVSRLVFGAAGVGFSKGQDQSLLLDQLVDEGIQTIDTARVYGQSETVIGKWFKNRKNRHDIVCISKGGHPSFFKRNRLKSSDLRKDLETSLRQLQTDYIDLYLLHRDVTSLPIEVIIETLNTFKQEGKILQFGVLNWNYQRIEMANQYALSKQFTPLIASSPHYSLGVQHCDPWGAGCVSITGEQNHQQKIWYQQNQMPIFAYSSLSRGLFSGKVKSDSDSSGVNLDRFAKKAYAYEDNFERLRRVERLAGNKACTVSQIALAWVLHQPLNVFPIVSASSIERMRDNIKAIAVVLTADECDYLNLKIDRL